MIPRMMGHTILVNRQERVLSLQQGSVGAAAEAVLPPPSNLQYATAAPGSQGGRTNMVNTAGATISRGFCARCCHTDLVAWQASSERL
jgi:hypothetical protein